MNSGFRSQVVPSFRLLTEEQIREIHLASLDLLARVGVRVLNDEGLQTLRDAGCEIAGNVARIPGWLVEECLRRAPSRITLYNRKGEEAMRLEGRKFYYGMGTDLITTYDIREKKYRPTMLQDVINAVRVADACAEIDFIASLGLAHDVPINAMYVESVKADIENTTKPIFFTAGGSEDLAFIIEMAAAVAGGEAALRQKPFLINYSEPTPPLTHSYGAVRKLFLCADKGVPICYTPAMLMGGSGPITMAGAIVQANAEALSGLTLHQLRAKGAPIISGFATPPLDMAASTASYGAPEMRLCDAAMSDLYHYYGIPMWATTGSDAHAFDAQAAIEHTLAIYNGALSGSNLIHDVGFIGQGLLSHPAVLLMCNEIIGYVKRLMRGFELTPETMALDVIQSVGPGGNYMAEEHTVRYFRKEQWRPQFMNRADPDTWHANGGQTYEEVVERKTLALLQTHTPEPLPPAVQEQVDAIAGRARAALANVHFQA
jgi:trimethylamine--corrinoid protein Co-methyltransferase